MYFPLKFSAFNRKTENFKQEFETMELVMLYECFVEVQDNDSVKMRCIHCTEQAPITNEKHV